MGLRENICDNNQVVPFKISKTHFKLLTFQFTLSCSCIWIDKCWILPDTEVQRGEWKHRSQDLLHLRTSHHPGHQRRSSKCSWQGDLPPGTRPGGS